jgi:hypothetical protein
MHLCIRARKPFQPTKQAHQVSESIEKQVVKDKGGGKGGTEGGTKSTRMESTRTESTRIQLCAQAPPGAVCICVALEDMNICAD